MKITLLKLINYGGIAVFLIVMLYSILSGGKIFNKQDNPLDITLDTLDNKNVPPVGQDWFTVEISDGDTITVRQTNGDQMKIRFCGIDAPEKKQKFGNEAKDYLRSLIQKSNNIVSVVPVETDKYGRTIAEVFVRPEQGTSGYQPGEEIFLNGEMVRAGFAQHYTRYSNNCFNKNVIERSEEIAKENRAGIWSDPNYIPPWEWRKKQRNNRGKNNNEI